MIYTFYSYKGGVGRSMALANVAELLYRSGLKVLMVDWDLEAPGLERFFPSDLREMLNKPGVIEMLLEYKAQMAQDLSMPGNGEELPFEKPSQFAVDIYPEGMGDGRLWLLPAGRRSIDHFGDYAYAVRTFDWQDLYENWEGELYFEWLRRQFERMADVVLIDSRTGVTEMGGVCTYQLSDVVVMFCTPSQQSIDGTYKMAQNFRNPRVKSLRRGRTLNLLVIPARIERAESELLDEYQREFLELFKDFAPETEGITVRQLWDLAIPYVPKYAFTEALAVRDADRASAEDIVAAFRGLAEVAEQLRRSKPLTIRFDATDSQTCYVNVERSDLGRRRGRFSLPYSSKEQEAIGRILATDFTLEMANEATQSVLEKLGGQERARETVGTALTNALLADQAVREGFEIALGIAEDNRQTLPLQMEFGDECSSLMTLPWELLRYKDLFLVADSSVSLSRHPVGVAPSVPAAAELPLEILLIISEPLGISPLFSTRAREQLIQGLYALEGEGPVILHLLRPPSLDSLREAVRKNVYHVLIFYGHHYYDSAQGMMLLFEDAFGGQALVRANELGAVLRNTDVCLALLGTPQSAQANERDDIQSGIGPSLLRAGVPLVIEMQSNMRIDSAQTFIRQMALSLAAGKPVGEAVADARTPLIRAAYGGQWFVPRLYGRPADVDRLFDQTTALPDSMADVRAAVRELRVEMENLENAIEYVGVDAQLEELIQLRSVRQRLAEKRVELMHRTPGGYVQVTSPHYGVPSNRVFVGREVELRQVAQSLLDEHPVVLWGVAGIGKTALAIEVADRQGWRFPAGVLWLDCRDTPPFDTLLNRIGAFCGIADIEQIESKHKEATVRRGLTMLKDRCLLIWDGVEGMWQDRIVRQFIRELPGNCQALFTTRANLEQPMWRTIEVAPLTDAAMTTLFDRLASAAGVTLRAQVDLEAVPKLVTWLEGHPLAMTMVVPLVAKRGIRRLWREVQQRSLKGVKAAFALSYEQLSALQQCLFGRLSVFTIPFDWQAVEALLPDEEKTQVADTLDVLVQRALVMFDGTHYAYHRLLRQYAYEKLQEMEDPRAVHQLAAEFLKAKLTDEKLGGTPKEALEEVDHWERAEAWERFARRASALVGSLDRLGYWGEIEERLERGLTATRSHLDDEPELEATLLTDLGIIAYKRAEWDRAIDMYEKSFEIRGQGKDRHGIAQTLNNLGLVCADKGEWDRAIDMYQQSLEILGRVGDVHGMAQTFNNLGLVYADKGEWDRAIDMYQQSLEILGRVGDMHGIAQTWSNLGLVYARKGEWDRAIDMYQQSLEASERVGDVHSIAQTFNNLGLVYADKGEWDRAIDMYQQSLEISERVGDVHGIAQTWSNLGLVYARKGEWDRAIDIYQQSLETFEHVGDVHGQAVTWGNLGQAYADKGEWDRAIEMYEQSLETKERVGDVHGMAQTWGNLGSVYLQKGEWDQAIEYYEKSLETKKRMGDVHGIAQTWSNLGLVYARKGEWDRAIDMYQQCMETFERVGDVHGQAVTWSNLGLAYADKGERDRAIEMYQQSSQAFERVGDVYGIAQTWSNLALSYWETGRTEEAKPLMAQAYIVFSQLGSPHADSVAQGLVQVCGSIEAANSCLANLASEDKLQVGVPEKMDSRTYALKETGLPVEFLASSYGIGELQELARSHDMLVSALPSDREGVSQRIVMSAEERGHLRKLRAHLETDGEL